MLCTCFTTHISGKYGTSHSEKRLRSTRTCISIKRGLRRCYLSLGSSWATICPNLRYCSCIVCVLKFHFVFLLFLLMSRSSFSTALWNRSYTFIVCVSTINEWTNEWMEWMERTNKRMNKRTSVNCQILLSQLQREATSKMYMSDRCMTHIIDKFCYARVTCFPTVCRLSLKLPPREATKLS